MGDSIALSCESAEVTSANFTLFFVFEAFEVISATAVVVSFCDVAEVVSAGFSRFIFFDAFEVISATAVVVSFCDVAEVVSAVSFVRELLSSARFVFEAVTLTLVSDVVVSAVFFIRDLLRSACFVFDVVAITSVSDTVVSFDKPEDDCLMCDIVF